MLKVPGVSISKYLLLVTFMKGKRKKGRSQSTEDEQSDQSDDEEVNKYFCSDNENEVKERYFDNKTEMKLY